jgi:XTP/dITP diphosphohydrolase
VTTFVLATANPHKADEMRAVLVDLDIELIERPVDVPEVEETEDTLEGNALLKARALVEATGRPAIADDTGLFVEVLNGRPGVFSARYAGESASDRDNVEKLLAELEGVDEGRRRAQFRTVIAVAYPQRGPTLVVGTLDGSITAAPRGEGGFGYDPVFAPNGAGGRTLAQMSPDQKNAISHRGNALRALALALAKQ